MSNPRFIPVVLIAAVAGAAGFFMARATFRPAAPAASPVARKVLFYQSPMHPWIKSDQPGKCTICGMDLVPVYADEAGAAVSDKLVTLSSTSARVLGVQTALAHRAPLVRTLRVAGVIDDDDTRHRFLAARVPGRVEKLYVNYVGSEVAADAPLVTLYSPEVLSAERLFVERVKAGAASTAAERAEARERLLQLGLTADEITQLEQTLHPAALVTLRAPFAGTVVTRAAYEGQYVQAQDRLFEIGDFSKMWFMFDAYETDLPWLRVGQKVEITTPSHPGKVFTAPIDFIDPNLNESTRTARVRVVIENPFAGSPVMHDPASAHHALLHRVTAYGRVTVERPETLLIPRSAVLQTGTTAIGYVDRGGGAYEPRSLTLGRPGDDEVEILAGLNEGDRVVTQGTLMLDAQAQLAHLADPGRREIAGDSVDAVQPEIDTLKPLVLATADAAEALARDDLDRYQQGLAALRDTFAAYAKKFPDAKQGPLAQFIAGLKPGTDLKAARAAFEVFSTAVADLAEDAHLQRNGVIRIYQCPMSPVLGRGRWLQRSGPMRNPFFGSAMPDCGEEIK